MKRIICSLVAICLAFCGISAQNAYRSTGSVSADLGVGFGYSRDNYESVVLPPIKADIEYTLYAAESTALSVGAYFGMNITKDELVDDRWTTVLVGPMASYRLVFLDNFDLFAKIILGYRSMSYESVYYRSFGYGFYAGATWYFSKNVGLGAEIGYGGPTLLGAHLTIKL